MKNTSLKSQKSGSESSGNGRRSTPGVVVSMISALMPLCFGTVGSVRTKHRHQSAWCAPDVHTFWPFTTNSSPIELGACLQAREVAARARLAHAEAPRDLGAQRRAEEPLLLLGRAVVVDRRGDDAETLRVRAAHDLAAARSPRNRSSAASASRCDRRAPAANPARASPRRTARAATSRAHSGMCALDCFGSRNCSSDGWCSVEPRDRARRGTPRPRVRTAGASRRRVVS